MSVRKWALIGALALCVVLFVVGCMVDSGSSRAVVSSSSPQSSAGSTLSLPSSSLVEVPELPSGSEEVTPVTVSSSPTTASSDTPPATKEVAPCMPRRLRIDYEELRINVNVATTQFAALPKLPGGNENAGNVFFVEGLGVMPASETQNSTYIFGHSWQSLPDGQLARPFTALSNRAVRGEDASRASTDVRGTKTRPVTNLDGLKVVLECDSAVLEYSLRESFLVAKPDLMSVQRVYNDDPGSVEAGNPSILPNRLVVVTCAADEQVGDKDDSVVLLLYLAGATPK